ncbi:hypothetical protein [Streptomyces sp. NPDC023838]|uniref:LpxL/LpxP family acyltransferase n=1 Tax=Streptomyces sp. NPDC023838 TaxID=3154325 RepID=UPI0033E0A2FC
MRPNPPRDSHTPARHTKDQPTFGEYSLDLQSWRHTTYRRFATARRVRVLRENLHTMFPDISDRQLDHLTVRCTRQVLLRFCEFFTPSSSRTRSGSSRVSIANPERLARGQGAVVVTAHMACPILAAYWIAENYGPVSLVSYTNNRYPKVRLYPSRRTRQVRFSNGRDLRQISVLRERLARNEFVLAMPDTQTPPHGGVEVRFFRQRTRMLAGPALLALQAGVPLNPLTLWHDGSSVMHGEIHHAVRISTHGTVQERATQAIQEVADVFEKAITRHPDSWALFKPLWPSAIGHKSGQAATDTQRSQPDTPLAPR